MQTKSKNIVADLKLKGWKKKLTFPHDYAILQKDDNCILVDLSVKKIITEWGTEWGSQAPSMKGKVDLDSLKDKGWKSILPYPHNYVVLKKNSHLLLVDTSVNKIVVSWTE